MALGVDKGAESEIAQGVTQEWPQDKVGAKGGQRPGNRGQAGPRAHWVVHASRAACSTHPGRLAFWNSVPVIFSASFCPGAVCGF